MGRDSTGNWRIDVHHHVVPPQYADASMPIKIPDADARLAAERLNALRLFPRFAVASTEQVSRP